MVCRLCLNESFNLIEIFGEQGTKMEIPSILSTHFWFELKIDDPVSTSICSRCWHNTENFHVFYLNVKEAQNMLERSSAIGLSDEVIIKTECTEGAMERKNKMFLTVRHQNIIARVTIAYLEELSIQDIEASVVQFGSNITFSHSGLPLERDDVVDFIMQYGTDPNFVLDIAGENPDYTSRAVSRDAQCVPIDETLNLDSSMFLNVINDIVGSSKDLESFLNTNAKCIVQAYKQNKVLTNQQRVDVSKIIIRHILNNDTERILQRPDFIKLASYLVEIFPGESEGIYYTPFTMIAGRRQAATGKLWSQYTKYREELANIGFINRRKRSGTSTSKSLPSTESRSITVEKPTDLYTNDEEDQKALEDLKKEGCGAVKEKWNKTFYLRNKILKTSITVSEFITLFPPLQQPEGLELLSLDCQKLYGVLPKLEERIEDVYPSLLHLGLKSKNNFAKKVVQMIDAETTDSNKKALSLILLPYLLPNTLLKTKDSTHCAKRPCKVDIQESFISCYQTLSEADSEEHKYVQRCRTITAVVHPKIVVVGSPVSIVYVWFAERKYIFQTLAPAIDACMAIYLGLNISYPGETQRVWYFVQKKVFNITKLDDNIDPAVETLANDLKNIKSKNRIE